MFPGGYYRKLFLLAVLRRFWKLLKILNYSQCFPPRTGIAGSSFILSEQVSCSPSPVALSHPVGFPSGCHDNPLHTESCKPLPPSACLPEKRGHVLLLKDEQSPFQTLLVQAEHLPPPSQGACLTKLVSDVSSHLLCGA